MKYIIMCGGKYTFFDIPKPLTVVNGETLVEHTINLLSELGISKENIKISTHDPRYEYFGVELLRHDNSYVANKDPENNPDTGYWLDAYYPTDEPVTYLHGDVYFTKPALQKIVDCASRTDINTNTLIGNSIAMNEMHYNWGEPFGYIVKDNPEFFSGIDAVKKLQDEGKLKRMALCWELYRYLNDLDINVQTIIPDNNSYLVIDDGCIDIDAPFQQDKYKNYTYNS